MKITPMRLWRNIRSRPRLLSSTVLGVATWLLLPPFVASHEATRILIGWNVGAAAYMLLAWTMMARSGPEQIRQRAIRQDDGRLVVLTLALTASVAVLVAVASQMAVVKDMRGWQRGGHVALAAGTVVVAWLFVQTTFALHYAHDFFLARTRGMADSLQFPGTPDPGYADFMYFACIIGTSGQTADVSFVGSSMRPIGMVHCVMAFFFNVAMIGLTINIAASLF